MYNHAMKFKPESLVILRQSLDASRARAREDLSLILTLAGGDVGNPLVRSMQAIVNTHDDAYRDVMKAIESLQHDEDR